MSHNKYNIASAVDYALIDLHLHLDGSLSLATVKKLAQMQDIAIPEDDTLLLEKLQVSADCRDLNEYLEKFAFPVSLLQTKQALCEAAYRLAEELKEEGLLYAEIRFAPQLHTQKGLSQSEITAAVLEGLHKSDFRCALILCCMRGDQNLAENLETVRVAKEYLHQGVCAVDLAGAEALFPTHTFESVFSLTRKLNVPCTIHAGEADGPQSMYKAIEFGAKRIGHGVRSVQDKDLMALLADKKITLELCPTSNLNTHIFEDLSEYPIVQLMAAGVRVCLNTDNITVSNVTLRSEMQKIADTFNLDHSTLRTLALNAAEATFADEDTKAWLKAEIEKR